MFFDDLNNREDVDLHGKSMDLSVDKKIRLRDIVSYDLSQCEEKTEFSYWEKEFK